MARELVARVIRGAMLARTQSGQVTSPLRKFRLPAEAGPSRVCTIPTGLPVLRACHLPISSLPEPADINLLAIPRTSASTSRTTCSRTLPRQVPLPALFKPLSPKQTQAMVDFPGAQSCSRPASLRPTVPCLRSMHQITNGHCVLYMSQQHMCMGLWGSIGT